MAYDHIYAEVMGDLDPDDVVLHLAKPQAGPLTYGGGGRGDTEAPAPHSPRSYQRHHYLARLMVEGHSTVVLERLTGYARTTIYTLKKDPAFQELLSVYGEQRDVIFSGNLERVSILGATTLDILQTRMEEEPERVSTKELTEIMALCTGLGKGTMAGHGDRASAKTRELTINFVGEQRGVITIEGRVEE